MKKCPSCAEKIQNDALVCRHCGAQFDPDDVAKQVRAGRWYRAALVGVPLLLIGSCVFGGPETPPTEVASSGCQPGQSCFGYEADDARKRVTVERFAWQSYGDRYCKANAKIRNDGGEAVRFLRIELQFLRGGEIVDSDSSYATSSDIQPGETTTWSSMYECPGKEVEVEVTATARGAPVILDFKD
jgi:hypothetical protein